MSNVIPLRPRDHVVIELLTVRESDGSLVPKYFVSSVFDGATSFGDFDSLDREEARVVAAEYGLPVIDKTEGIS